MVLIRNYHSKTTFSAGKGVFTKFHFGSLTVYKMLPLFEEGSQFSTRLNLW